MIYECKRSADKGLINSPSFHIQKQHIKIKTSLLSVLFFSVLFQAFHQNPIAISVLAAYLYNSTRSQIIMASHLKSVPRPVSHSHKIFICFVMVAWQKTILHLILWASLKLSNCHSDWVYVCMLGMNASNIDAIIGMVLHYVHNSEQEMQM